MAKEQKVLINGGYPLHTFEQLEEKYREYMQGVFKNYSE